MKTAVTVLAVLMFAGLAAADVSAAEKEAEKETVTLTADDMSAWGRNAGAWKVVHNGKLIHENVELTGPTRAASFGDEKPLGPLMLQGDHGPVVYRNIRLTGTLSGPKSTSGAK